MPKTFEALKRAKNERNIDIYSQIGDHCDLIDGHGDDDHLSPPAAIMRIEGTGAFESLKATFTNRFLKKDIKTIIVTGISRGCGVSTNAIGLAASLTGHANLRVLLIDGNLQSSDLHRFFNIDPHPGLSDLLLGKTHGELEIKRVGEKQLYVLPGGTVSEKTVGPQTFKRLEHFLAMVRSSFDFIIIDVPAQAGDDSFHLFCPVADGAIIVMEAGKASPSSAISTKEKIENAGARVLGVILNREKQYIPEWLNKRL